MLKKSCLMVQLVDEGATWFTSVAEFVSVVTRHLHSPHPLAAHRHLLQPGLVLAFCSNVPLLTDFPELRTLVCACPVSDEGVVGTIAVFLSRSSYERSPGGKGGLEISWSRASSHAPELTWLASVEFPRWSPGTNLGRMLCPFRALANLYLPPLPTPGSSFVVKVPN